MCRWARHDQRIRRCRRCRSRLSRCSVGASFVSRQSGSASISGSPRSMAGSRTPVKLCAKLFLAPGGLRSYGHRSLGGAHHSPRSSHLRPVVRPVRPVLKSDQVGQFSDPEPSLLRGAWCRGRGVLYRRQGRLRPPSCVFGALVLALYRASPPRSDLQYYRCLVPQPLV